MSKEFLPIRIENKRFEKNIRLFKILAILSAILVVFRVLTTPAIFTGTGKLMDFGTTLIPIFLFFEYRRKSKKWGGQFIEWTNEDLNFKTRHSQQTSIPNTSITAIEIKLDEILVLTSEQGEHKIVVEDFTEYSDRISIKSNFKELQNRLNLTKA